MKWSMDTHKFMSETTRKALQVLSSREITSRSSVEEIEAVENELGSCGVYKNQEGAHGRVKRALFTYFKSYECLDSNENLTELGKLFVENRITVQEFCFRYVLNYKPKGEDVDFYPANLVLKCFYMLYKKDPKLSFLSGRDFSKIIECVSTHDITDSFIDDLISARKNDTSEINDRTTGFDVWGYMFVNAGIFIRTADKTLTTENVSLIEWVLTAYEQDFDTVRGTFCTGLLTQIPKIELKEQTGTIYDYVGERLSVQSFLFEGASESIIDKYIIRNSSFSFSEVSMSLGMESNLIGFYSDFCGLERLVGFCLLETTNLKHIALGKFLTNDYLEESQLNELEPELSFTENLETLRLITGCNVLLYGVPGSGKSWTIEQEYCKSNSKVERLVFHPDYTYSDFIGQILPNVAEDGQVSYKFTPGPFTNILRDAYHNPENEYILIIEEINRGNAPAIFGEVFQLLDRKVTKKEVSDDGFPIGTSEYGITNANIAQEVYENSDTKIRIPSNLSILGTMNTSDQNVFTLDTAFQRRWDMRLIENSFANVNPTLANAEILDTTITWRSFCTTINNIVIGNSARMTSSEDKRLGAYFVHASDLEKNKIMENFSQDEYDHLRKNKSINNLTDDEQYELSQILEAMKQYRKFPEKVLKYLWDDAFKFNREVVFESTEYQSLEQIIHVFMYSQGIDRFKMFKENVISDFQDSE